MKSGGFRHLPSLLAGSLLVFLPATSSACTACMGDASSKTGAAINGAIFLMLACIGSMLTLLAAFAWHLIRRAQLPEPPHVAATAMLNDSQGS